MADYDLETVHGYVARDNGGISHDQCGGKQTLSILSFITFCQAYHVNGG